MKTEQELKKILEIMKVVKLTAPLSDQRQNAQITANIIAWVLGMDKHLEESFKNLEEIYDSIMLKVKLESCLAETNN